MKLTTFELLDPALQRLYPEPFTTQAFIREFALTQPRPYAEISKEYGAGGRGSGKHYSANVHFGKSLSHYRDGVFALKFKKYIPAPADWGSRLIALWHFRDVGGEYSGGIDQAAIDLASIAADQSLSPTERARMILARVGQGAFRKGVVAYWGKCAATGCPDVSLLTASHIKPWKDSNRQERLCPSNGLLLVPNIDRLFDKGFITFDSTGKVVISSRLSQRARNTFGLDEGLRVKLTAEHQHYMEHHRRYVFDAKTPPKPGNAGAGAP